MTDKTVHADGKLSYVLHDMTGWHDDNATPLYSLEFLLGKICSDYKFLNLPKPQIKLRLEDHKYIATAQGNYRGDGATMANAVCMLIIKLLRGEHSGS